MRILRAIGIFLMIAISTLGVLTLFFGSFGFVIICLIGGIIWGKIWFARCLVWLVIFAILIGMVSQYEE
jgi:hypothetical protein